MIEQKLNKVGENYGTKGTRLPRIPVSRSSSNIDIRNDERDNNMLPKRSKVVNTIKNDLEN